MKFSIKNFFSKCEQIRWKLRIWSHLLKKSLMENLIFCAVMPILLSIFFNDFYYFILFVLAHNFADENTLSIFAKRTKNLISILESEHEIAINRFKVNHMTVNQDKFQVVIFDIRKRNQTNQIINTDRKETEAVSKVKFLGKQIDDKLNFNHHINNITIFRNLLQTNSTLK